MADGIDAELFEKLADQKHREASERWAESEQRRLTEAFVALDKLTASIKADDRRAMLELLTISADSLRAFEAMPEDARSALANGLEEIRNNLEEAKGFLPRGRGERSERWTRQHEKAEFFTALAVEWARWFSGLKLESSRQPGAKEKVAKDFGMKYDVVHKRWRRHHAEVTRSLEMVHGLLEEAGLHPPKLPRKRARRA